VAALGLQVMLCGCRARPEAGADLAARGRQVSKQLLMESLDSDILAAVGCVPNEDVWRKKEIKENTRANLTQRKCGPAARRRRRRRAPPPPRRAPAARARAAAI